MMLRSPTVRDDGIGSAVLVKHATGTERSRLRHEAELLDTIRVEGVVTAVGFDDVDGRCELRLQYLEAATLAEHPPLGLSDVLDVLIAAGTTLAELHHRGVRHGALSPDHVLLARPLRPVLCGFGDATGPADPQQHPPGTDLAGIAAVAEAELTRTDRALAVASERRHCGDALIASRDLAAAAAEAPHDGDALQSWIARLEAIRHAASSAPHDTDIRLPLLGTERGLSARDRRWIAAPAVAVALVIVAVIGWRALSGGEIPEAVDTLHAADDPIAPITSIDASETASHEPAGVPPTEPDADHSAPAPPGTMPSSDDAARSGATLLYGTARHECPPGDTPETGDDDASNVDCPETQPGTDPVHDALAGLLTLPSGQWSLAEADDLPSLSCDVVVVHYGELSIETGQSAPPPPGSDS